MCVCERMCVHANVRIQSLAATVGTFVYFLKYALLIVNVITAVISKTYLKTSLFSP